MRRHPGITKKNVANAGTFGGLEGGVCFNETNRVRVYYPFSELL